MPSENASTNGAPPKDDGLGRARSQLGALRRRLEGLGSKLDPAAIKELVAAVDQIASLLGGQEPAEKSGDVPWPSDMANPRQRELDWGRDPEGAASV